ncbi:hypothetical protein DPMN_085133 [Dreissena polymorpha]|uniref:Uncharacterized protein n=1 Tax=Dreissena polymorpha TaxID=45954 RepID=A0A9D4BLK7_DREPO|nr:hypothetical protein DPMN_085133 [Dreissena polymorpha]
MNTHLQTQIHGNHLAMDLTILIKKLSTEAKMKLNEPFGQEMNNDDASTDGEGVSPIWWSLDSVTDVDDDTIYACDVKNENNPIESDTESTQMKLGLMTGHNNHKKGIQNK